MATIFEKYGQDRDSDPGARQDELNAKRELAAFDIGRLNLWSVVDAYRRFGDFGASHRLALLGYFCGDHNKDIELIRGLGMVGADDAKFLPVILEEIVRSAGVAVRNLDRVYQDLSLGEIEVGVSRGKIGNPYDLGLVEEALIQSVVPEVVSITVSPLELDKKPAWWDSYSANFQRVLKRYILFPSK